MTMIIIHFFSVLLLLKQGLSFNTEWELNQFSQIEAEYYSNSAFNSIEDIIKDSRNATKHLMNERVIPGLVIGLSIKGKTIWKEAFGSIDIENNVTTDQKSVWRLASISKPLTSALVAQLIDKKLVNLNDSIHKYIPGHIFPKKTFDGHLVDITIRQLLSHTAGLHFTDIVNDFNTLFKAENVTDMIGGLKNDRLLFKPGTQFSYSNYGFQVMGAIIESVLKNSYLNEIKKIFIKLGMNYTFAETRDQIIKHRPRYYVRGPDQHIPLQNVELLDDLFSYEGWWPSGGMVSTVEDLLLFGNAMLSASKGKTKDFLSESVVKEFWKPETIGLKKLQDFGTNEYAKGWLINHIPDSVNYPFKNLIWHSGGLLGTSTMLLLLPDQDIVGVAFSNLGLTIGLDQLLLYIAKNFYEFM